MSTIGLYGMMLLNIIASCDISGASESSGFIQNDTNGNKADN
jgi:hypothetical protein